jgi:glycosyltransferase involved in cell wall biosynthesis
MADPSAPFPGEGKNLRVLLINFTLDDESPVLPWQSAVARALAQRVESVHVFTEWLGVFDNRPANLTVDAMPHWPFGIPRRLGSRWLMLPKLVRAINRFKPDVCFVHMAHEWCYRIGPYLRARGIPVLLWYAHGSVPLQLHLATRFASAVVTSTPEGFRIDTPKKRVIGQAIDTALFTPPLQRPRGQQIVSVGRISRRKRVDLIIEAMARLVARHGFGGATLDIVGPSLTTDDTAYQMELHQQVARLGLSDSVAFHGPMPQSGTASLYKTADLHVNVSETGSMDKTAMEALASGCPVLTSNPAFFTDLAVFPDMLIRNPAPETLADAMAGWLMAPDPPTPQAIRGIVTGKHDFDGYADRIVSELVRLKRG